MLRIDFNDNWVVSAAEEMFFSAEVEAIQVTLPHDAQIAQKRDAACRTKSKTGYYNPGSYTYKKRFYAGSDLKQKKLILEFEGVYMNAMVYVNGDFAGQRPYGYSQFTIDLTPFLFYDAENEIKVIAKTSEDSRWYTGIGIYRPVYLYQSELLYIAVDGVRISTPEIDDDQATVVVRTSVINESTESRRFYVKTTLKDQQGEIVATDSTPMTLLPVHDKTSQQRLVISNPQLWSPDQPALYTCETKLFEAADIFSDPRRLMIESDVHNTNQQDITQQKANYDQIIDQTSHHFGIRSIKLDVRKGLRINDQVVKLRGACIHHDSGVLGAATFSKAEERRVRLMKQAGFNALRSAHHPMSNALLDACDRYGMLVMDESFDMWCINKSAFDYALSFPEWWERDIKAMIDKDFNHPSVLLYSIGNEVPDTGLRFGGNWSRKLTEKVRELDPTRYTINSINSMISTIDQLKKTREESQKSALKKDQQSDGQSDQDKLQGDINELMANLAENMSKMMGLEYVVKAVEEAYAAADIAGYNYMDSRYLEDHRLYSNRVICGSETFPDHIDINWQFVKQNPFIIGDFTWTGWDYLGEAAIGKTEYEQGSEPRSVYGEFPWYIAYCGDFDIIGNRRPASYYREIVWGLRSDPYIAVQRPENYGKKPIKTPWSWTDSIASWTWPDHERKPVIIEVYADADEVELLINNKSIGRKPVGEVNRFRAEFDTIYEKGEVKAAAFRDGKMIGLTYLQTASDVSRLLITADRQTLEADGQDLCYLSVALTDEQGVVNRASDRKITIDIGGPGTLQGFGSADPKSTEYFFEHERTTFDGYVLAVVRADQENGTIRVRFQADQCEPATIELNVGPC